jgi:hypothetical protein
VFDEFVEVLRRFTAAAMQDSSMRKVPGHLHRGEAGPLTVGGRWAIAVGSTGTAYAVDSRRVAATASAT